MNNHQNNFNVITGGPGAGKSTLIEALSKKEFRVVPEHGRQILKEQLSIGGKALHWEDSILYKELILSRDLMAYHQAKSYKGVVYFDRSLVDVLGYTRLLGLKDEAHVLKAINLYRYNKKVFIAPPWKEIYANDEERKQDFNEAIHTYEAMKSAYSDSGYELINLPKVSVDKRLEFILECSRGLL
ncbi:AAA family ATPase [Xanthovirga aplysinae]|uniref:AAA family ATPase n=1 Tax=Xanthovirga aplysinae TaxID=2529853 RepID=UPI0012BBFEA8|nr:AAA family ATPase [Xanthovirga aplysinae]MTI30954.1 ATPase [Xanthovirga aplysinae]